VHAQKFLSCIYRIYEKQGFGFGLNHVVDVLAGADTEAIRQRGHDELSTYGIGKDVKRTAWLAIGRELLRLGLIAAAPGKFATLELTDAGRVALRERKSITLTKPFDVETTKRSKKHRAGEIKCDEALFEQLRALRRQIADKRDVPAYVIFSDVALREMARAYPTTEAEFRRIPGVGEQKLRDFAEPFTAAVRDYLATNPPQLSINNQSS
jgi:ATP-dependent DNA helicase RecQ